jgi:hypothetical protein
MFMINLSQKRHGFHYRSLCSTTLYEHICQLPVSCQLTMTAYRTENPNLVADTSVTPASMFYFGTRSVEYISFSPGGE